MRFQVGRQPAELRDGIAHSTVWLSTDNHCAPPAKPFFKVNEISARAGRRPSRLQQAQREVRGSEISYGSFFEQLSAVRNAEKIIERASCISSLDCRKSQLQLLDQPTQDGLEVVGQVRLLLDFSHHIVCSLDAVLPIREGRCCVNGCSGAYGLRPCSPLLPAHIGQEAQLVHVVTPAFVRVILQEYC
jgi:hypothetical protein